MSDNADVRNFFCVRALSFGVASFARARVALSRGFHTGNSFLFLNGGKNERNRFENHICLSKFE